MAVYRRLADADATRSFFRADGNYATEVTASPCCLMVAYTINSFCRYSGAGWPVPSISLRIISTRLVRALVFDNAPLRQLI